jgi:hypothetical protein
VACVDPPFQAFAQFGVLVFGGEKFHFGLQAAQNFLREAVGEAKGDVLG